VKGSAPEKPAKGVYVAVVPARPTVPFAGCDTIRSVRAFPSGSVALSATATGVPAGVETERFRTTAARFGFGSLLDGPLWHV